VPQQVVAVAEEIIQLMAPPAVPVLSSSDGLKTQYKYFYLIKGD
jgi:hypothetical protein